MGRKITRRGLIGAGAAAAPAIAALHEVVPHQGLHSALGGNQHASAAAETPHAGHAAGSGLAMHDGFGSGTVDHDANGFDPTEIVRDFDYGEASSCPTAGLCASGPSSPRTRRSRSRPASRTPPGPTTGGSPARRSARTEGDRMRIKFVNGSAAPAHDPLPRHPSRLHGRHAGHRRGARRRPDRDGRELHLRVRRRALRPPPLPLPRDAARRAHRQGALRRVHRRPEGAAAGGRRAGDGHERLRHQLRRRQRDLRGQHDPRSTTSSTRSRSSAASWCGSTS